MGSYFLRKNSDYTPSEIKEMVHNIKHQGFVEVSNYFTKESVEKAVQYIGESQKKLGTSSFSVRYYDMDPCIFTELQKSVHLKSFLTSILNESGVSVNENDVIHNVIRCVSGEKRANKYHFDAYDLTMLMPIITPENENLLCGDLVVFPNTRNFSTNLLKNILFKLAFQNKIVNKFSTKEWFKKLLNAKVVKVKPGNAYLFYGFRSYHGNIGVDNRLIRATALFHFHDPFEDSRFIKTIERNRAPPQNRKN